MRSPSRACGSTSPTAAELWLSRRCPTPRRRRAKKPASGRAAHRGRVVLTELGHEARPQLGRIAVQVIPAVDEGVREGAGKNQRPRSLRSCCREEDGGRAALARPEKHRASKPTASMTASISADRSSSVRTFGTGSDRPDPALSNSRTRQKLESRSKKATNSGTVQYSSMWLGERSGDDELDRSVPEHLIRQAQIAARCVRRFRHGMSVLRPGASPTGSDCVAPGRTTTPPFPPS